MATQKLVPEVMDDLAGRFRGELVLPGDAGYDDARSVWNGMIDRRPALIARCTSTADVVAAVDAARASGLTVSVRGGGHSVTGHATCDDGIVIDLSPMKHVVVDAEAQTARADGGLTWGEFDAATQEHGLAVTGGRFSTTGIGGLTLGSGSGWLERKCGLSADNLLSAEVVLADGSVVTAGPDENADLFWGLRGGGGNFGIVTCFEYRLHLVGPIIYGGMLLSAPDRAGDILRCFRDLMEGAPDDLGGAVAFISAPPEPFVPEAARGKPAVGVVICWTGDHDEGERIVAPLREAAQPVADLVGPMPYAALQSMLDAGGPKGVRAYMKAEFLEDLGDEVVDKLADHGLQPPGPMTQLLIEPMGGAISRVRRAGHRSGPARHRVVLSRDRTVDGSRAGGAGRTFRVGAGDQPGPRTAHAARGVPELHLRRGRGARAVQLRRGALRPPRRLEGRLRPDEPLRPEPEHPALGDRLNGGTGPARAAAARPGDGCATPSSRARG